MAFKAKEPPRASYTPDVEHARDSASHAATREVLDDLFGPAAERPFAVELWDGSVDRPAREDAPFSLAIRRPGALRRMLLPLTELSLVEAYLSGDIDIRGDLESAAGLGDLVARRLATPRAVARLARHALSLPRDAGTAPHDEPEAHAARTLWRAGRAHSPARDRQAVRHHYDVGNDFYALWLGPQMVYSCAYFAPGITTLERAQDAKLDLVCRKLRLRPGERLLDIGCGWGALVMHAAKHYGADALGITLSEAQARLARARIAEAGLAGRCRIEVMDYRELQDPRGFDKISSIGMVEHVGLARLPEYFATAYRLLAPRGLFLNHGIVGLNAARPTPLRDRLLGRLWRRNAFIQRYVFPDGELVPLASVLGAAEAAGFETRDVESLREHYTRTLREWVARLERREHEAVAQVGETTFRIWRLYMAASAYGFRSARIGIVQSLLARPDASGAVGLPPTRDDLYA